VAKFAEKIIADFLERFLIVKNVIVPHQSGFRLGRSTHDNLFFLTQKISETLSLNKRSCAIFFDISKAFDKVWHNGLLYKMNSYGVSATIKKWIAAFLSDRIGFVSMFGVKSESISIETGVPQGSVIGPLLFSMYINDIPSCKSNNSFSLLFADDLVSCFSFTNTGKLDGIFDQMTRYLKELENWLNRWRLKKSPEKCCYTIFSKSANVKFKFELSMYGGKIPYAKENKFLGVTFDESLSFKTHIDLIVKKISNRLNIIKILSHKSWYLSEKTLINLYCSLIRSVFDYSFFLANSLSNLNLNKLQVIQNCALRSIYKVWFRGGVSDILHVKANIPRVIDRMYLLGNNFLKRCKFSSNALVYPLVNEFKTFIDSSSDNLVVYKCPLAFFSFGWNNW